MAKVVDEFNILKYKAMRLDQFDGPRGFTQYLIDGKLYDPVIVYDLPSCIAIVSDSDESFVGKTVEFR